MRETLTALDRWAVHASDYVTVALGSPPDRLVTTRVIQQPHALTGSRVGVGYVPRWIDLHPSLPYTSDKNSLILPIRQTDR